MEDNKTDSTSPTLPTEEGQSDNKDNKTSRNVPGKNKSKTSKPKKKSSHEKKESADDGGKTKVNAKQADRGSGTKKKAGKSKGKNGKTTEEKSKKQKAPEEPKKKKKEPLLTSPFDALIINNKQGHDDEVSTVTLPIPLRNLVDGKKKGTIGTLPPTSESPDENTPSNNESSIPPTQPQTLWARKEKRGPPGRTKSGESLTPSSNGDDAATKASSHGMDESLASTQVISNKTPIPSLAQYSTWAEEDRQKQKVANRPTNNNNNGTRGRRKHIPTLEQVPDDEEMALNTQGTSDSHRKSRSPEGRPKATSSSRPNDKSQVQHSGRTSFRICVFAAAFCCLIVGAVVAVLFLVVLKDDDTDSNTNVDVSDDDNIFADDSFVYENPIEAVEPGTVTSQMVPIDLNCDHFDQSGTDDTAFSNIWDQCECNSNIWFLPDDVSAMRDQLLEVVIPPIYGPLEDLSIPPATSCHPANMALLWLASGNNREPGYLLQRFILALLYYETSGPEWNPHDEWMSSSSECTWSGVQCNSQDVINGFVADSYNISGTVRISPKIGMDRISNVPARPNVLCMKLKRFSPNIPRFSFLSQCITGRLQIPTEFGLFEGLNAFSMSNNLMIGTIPTEILLLPRLVRATEHYVRLNGQCKLFATCRTNSAPILIL